MIKQREVNELVYFTDHPVWPKVYMFFMSYPGFLILLGNLTGIAYLLSQWSVKDPEEKRPLKRTLANAGLAWLTSIFLYLLLESWMPNRMAIAISFFIGTMGEAGLLLLQYNIKLAIEKRFGG